MEAGLKLAWSQTRKHPVAANDIGWNTLAVQLPVADHLKEDELRRTLKSSAPRGEVIPGAAQLAWLLRCQSGHAVDIGCLRVGTARVLHMPGELFVEYQLAAKAMRPDLGIAMAAYGDYGPSYIGTKIAYSEGGYETGPTASSVAPEVEDVLMDAMKKLLEVQP